MPIYKLMQGLVLEPEQRQTMGIVYEKLLHELGLKDRSDPICEMIAEKVIELGQRGESDPDRLHKLASDAIRL